MIQPAVQRPDERTICWAVALALLLHGLAFMALSRLPPEQMASPGAEGSIDVEILTQAPERPRPSPPVAQSRPQSKGPEPLDDTTQPTAPEQRSAATMPQPQAPGMIAAQKLYAADMLAMPRSQQARKGLEQLAPQERVVQLCNLEAMEQVHRWNADFDPDFLVAYAFSSVKVSGDTLKANGAAFRSKRHWRRIAYSCAVTPERSTVTGFSFKVGDAIPRAQWQDLGLSLADADD